MLNWRLENQTPFYLPERWQELEQFTHKFSVLHYILSTFDTR